MGTMEQFRLLSLQDDDDEVEIRVRPSASLSSEKINPTARWKVSRSPESKRRRSNGVINGPSAARDSEQQSDGGSLESLHFSFDKDRPVPPTQRRCGGCSFTFVQGIALSVSVGVIGFVLGYFVAHHSANVEIHSQPQDRDIVTNQTQSIEWKTHWQQKLSITPDFARCPKEFGFSQPALFVQSFDGFQADFIKYTPFLEYLHRRGASAASMRPVFPTSTFPNHYSIATGLYPESHGIIDNQFFSPQLNKDFVHWTSKRFEARFWKGKPIWQLAQEQGKRSYALYWPGSDVTINNMLPMHHIVYDNVTSVENRTETVIKYLQLPAEQRPSLILSYFHEPDNTAHFHWQNSSEFKNALDKVNNFAERIMEGLFSANLQDCVNVIFVSDHGVAPCKFERNPLRNSLAELNTEESTYVYEGQGTVNRIDVPPGTTAEKVLQSIACPHPDSPYQTYKKTDLPVRLHYYNSDAISPVLLLANVSSVMHRLSKEKKCTDLHNLHGWDNIYGELQAMFTAYGPSFKMNIKTEPFANVELFNLFADLLGIKPSENNGTEGSLRHLLRDNIGAPLEKPSLDPPSQVAFQDTHNVHIFEPACPFSLCSITNDTSAGKVTSSHDLTDFWQLHFGDYGVPVTDTFTTRSMNLLIDRDFGVGYSNSRDMPIWTAFRLPFVDSSKVKIPERTRTSCILNDPRIGHPDHPLQWCSLMSANDSDAIISAPLFPPGLSSPGFQLESLFTYNMVPMYASYYEGIWSTLWSVIHAWNHDEHNRLHVITGPVFDHLYPLGIADPVELSSKRLSGDSLRNHYLSSHFFVILTRKSSNSNCESLSCNVDVLSFIIPHRPIPKSPCQSDRVYLWTHTATVADVERITGLRFFNDLPVQQARQLRSRLVGELWTTD